MKTDLHVIGMKKLEKYLKIDRPKIQSESFFIAFIND